MARPFRFTPPEPSTDLIVRPAVQEALSGRFDRLVTVLVAGAGFGKTSALVQAFEETRLRPLGTDHWIALEAEDNDVQQALVGLSHCLGLEPSSDPHQFISRAIELFKAGAPSRQCLVIDDVHHISEDSPTADLLAGLLAELPANASLTLASRERPPLPLRRLELTGECVVVDEAALTFDIAAIDRLAQSHPEFDGDIEWLHGLAGWPALIRMALAQAEPASFMWEEVVDLLDDDQASLLRMLITVGDFDAELLARAAGVASAAPLERVPLVSRREGHFGAHDLWSTVLPDDGRDLDRRRSAMDVLVAAGEAPSAVDVGLAAAEPDGLADVLVTSVRSALLTTAHPDPVTLRQWHDEFGRTSIEHPALGLLDGLVARVDNPGSDECWRLLEHAADGFLALDDSEAAVSALGALAFAQHVRRDVAGLLTTFGRLGQLAEAGEPSARPYQDLANIIVGTSRADFAAVVEQSEVLLRQELGTDLRAITLWMRANALTNRGEVAIEEAAECYAIGLPLPGISFVHFGARWRAGLIGDLLENPIEPLAGERDTFLLATWNSVLYSAISDVETAKRWLAVVERSSSDLSQWQTAGSVKIPQAAVALVDDDFEAGRRILQEMIDAHPMDGPAVGYYLTSMPLYYPLFPELRSWFDTRSDLGPLYRRDLRINQAIVAVTEQGDLRAARDVELPDQVGGLITAIGLRPTAVLLAAAKSAGREGVDEVIAELIELVGDAARSDFRRAAESEVTAVAAGAREVLESMPVRPPDRVEVAVLGASRLTLGGELVESSDWRRERVRALLAFLVLHRSTTREQAIAALWPDADPAAGRRSLRSTLNVLNQVLEPGRVGGDAPFFVRSWGQRLQLVSDDHLEIDVDRFESLADEAERLEAAGMPSLSIDPYRRAAEGYGGDLLPDSYDDWVVFARDRLRSRFVRVSVRCAELLVATGRPIEAVDVVAPALAVEPWAEPAHRVLISAYVELGDLAAARRALATCRSVLDEVGGPVEDATSELERRLQRLE